MCSLNPASYSPMSLDSRGITKDSSFMTKVSVLFVVLLVFSALGSRFAYISFSDKDYSEMRMEKFARFWKTQLGGWTLMLLWLLVLLSLVLLLHKQSRKAVRRMMSV